MDQKLTPKNPYLIIGIVLFLILLLILAFIAFKQKQKIVMLLNERNYFLLEVASSSEQFRLSEESASSTIAELTKQLHETKIELESTEADLEREQDKNEDFARQLNRITGTVSDLKTLASIDEELLQKYSKVYFLNENYEPASLKQIPSEYILANRKDQYFHGDAWPFLEEMLEDAKADGVDLKVASAYRSFDTQAELKGAYTQTYGTGANAFSADQGYSEHQLGTTVDLSDNATGGTYTSFENTEAFAWLQENAYKYGFILSYPKGNAYYVYEPWHWRFVGTDLARDLARDGKNFYDLDQREIEEYRLELFD